MSVTGKQSFVLYHDLRKPLELLTDAERGQLFLAIFDYSEHGVIPDFAGAQQMAFAFIKTSLDRDAAAWEDKREKRREAGSLGGKQTQAKRANAAFALQGKQKAANQAVPVPAPVIVPVPVPANKKGTDKPSCAPRFTPPSIEEVAAYCRERGNAVNAEAFVDFYESKGWKVGNAPMKSWQAAVRSWERREREQNSHEKRGGWDFDDFA